LAIFETNSAEKLKNSKLDSFSREKLSRMAKIQEKNFEKSVSTTVSRNRDILEMFGAPKKKKTPNVIVVV